MTRKNKLQVVLVHGTWSSSARWAHAGSDVRQWLDAKLRGYYAEVTVHAVEWSGRNRAHARERATRELSGQLDLLRRADQGDAEYLLIGHSHGGNIATEAARQRLLEDPGFPLRGVACLNTPFLKHERRASSSYLVVWLLLCAAIGLGFAAALEWVPLSSRDAVEFAARVPALPRSSMGHFTLLFVNILLLGVAWFTHSKLQLRQARDRRTWGPRPRVLCLSSADDEAITLLGLGEGLANLPQLMLHPLALGCMILVASGAQLFHQGTAWCPLQADCWAASALVVGLSLSGWVGIALLAGVASSAAVTWIFGLSWRQFLETMATRVLVSYVPLQPANALFRAVSDYETRWSPMQLFHSRIYRAEATVDDIASWVLGTGELVERLRDRPEAPPSEPIERQRTYAA